MFQERKFQNPGVTEISYISRNGSFFSYISGTNFPSSKNEKKHTLKKFLYFGDMELSNPKLKKPYISEETCMAWKPKKIYISFHIQTQKKKVFYTFPYEETKFSKLKYFLIIKCFFSFYNFFSILNHFVFFILSDIFTTMLLLFFFFIFKKIF